MGKGIGGNSCSVGLATVIGGSVAAAGEGGSSGGTDDSTGADQADSSAGGEGSAASAESGSGMPGNESVFFGVNQFSKLSFCEVCTATQSRTCCRSSSERSSNWMPELFCESAVQIVRTLTVIVLERPSRDRNTR